MKRPGDRNSPVNAGSWLSRRNRSFSMTHNKTNKIYQKPFGDKVKKVGLYRRKIKKKTSACLRSVQYPKLQIFVKMFWTNLQSPVWSDYIGPECNIKVENALFNWKLRMFLSLWELFPDLTNRKAWNHIQSQIRNSSQYPPIRTGKFSIENSMSGKHLSWITDKQLIWNICLSSSINHAWMRLHNGL